MLCRWLQTMGLGLGLCRECGAAGWSVEGSQSNQNPNPKAESCGLAAKGAFLCLIDYSRLQYLSSRPFPPMQAPHRMGLPTIYP
jgi:hypothetical protein